MQRIEVATDVYVDEETVFEFLLDFPRYAEYSEYLEAVTGYGDGGPGTEYDLRFSWWRIGYTARSRVTDVQPHDRIDWRVVKDVDARGRWVLEEADAGTEAEGDSTRQADQEGSAEPAADEAAAATDRPPAADGAGDGSGPARTPATRVRLVIEYDPGTADADALGLPKLLSVDALVDRVAPVVRDEAHRIVERIVADLEGQPRDVELEVLETPSGA